MFEEVDYALSVAVLAPLVEEWRDSVVPAVVQLVPNSPYAAGYEWMYAYERGVRRRLARALGRPLGAWERRLFGPDGAFSEGLSNAFLHGHLRDGLRPIDVRWAVSRKGLAAAIADSGGGFDVAAQLAALGRGGTYFRVAGNGLRSFAQPRGISVAFARGGTEVHIRAMFD
jgi:anti-sigma regulatory factor (Ser/Thr protein kinase)